MSIKQSDEHPNGIGGEMSNKPKAKKLAGLLAENLKVPVCEDCDVLRAANLAAIDFYGPKKTQLFEKNLSGMITTHVDLGCKPCPVEDILKMIKKDRLAAIAALF